MTLFPKSKVSGIEKVKSKAMINSNISHEEFTLVVNEEKNYFRLKESIREKMIS